MTSRWAVLALLCVSSAGGLSCACGSPQETTASSTGTPSEGTPSEGTPSEGTPSEGTPSEGTPSGGEVRTSTFVTSDGVSHTIEVVDRGCSRETELWIDGCRQPHLACADGRWGLIGETYGEIYDAPETVAAETISVGRALHDDCR